MNSLLTRSKTSRAVATLLVLVLITPAPSAFAFQRTTSVALQPGSSDPFVVQQSSLGNRQPGELALAPATKTVPVLGQNGPGLRNMYAEPHAPPLTISGDLRLSAMMRDGKLYLSLRDALALAIDNNLDVQVQRYDLSIAQTDVVRARGGGSTRGSDLTVDETPQGVGGPGSPLLNAAAVSVTPSSPAVLDLTALNSNQPSSRNLSNVGTNPFSLGSAIPIFDPQMNMRFGWLRRDDAMNLASLSGSTVAQPSPGPYQDALASAGYVQGFGPGTQVQASVDNSAEALYPSASDFNPFRSPTLAVGVLQPLLRSRGRRVNERFIRIASINTQISALVFRQQLLNTVYGVARLYFDLVSLIENSRVKEDAVTAAKTLFDNDKAQVAQGTLPPLELTRAESLVSASQLDLVQAQALVDQEQTILKNQLLATGSSDPLLESTTIVPTDMIEVPKDESLPDLASLKSEALANRPDLRQSYLQVSAGQEAAVGSANNVRPELDLFANAELRGAGEGTFAALGSSGTGYAQAPIIAGGLRVDRVLEAGMQLNLPLRNRVAQADAARDALVVRQSQARTQLLRNQIQADVKNALVAVKAARSEYDAAVRSRVYQETLLQAERDKYSVGASTNLALIENQAYLAQARSTEVASKSNWQKAHLALDRAVGDLLEKTNIVFDDAVTGQIDTRR